MAARASKTGNRTPENESAFVRRLLIALGSRKELRVWRQNVGKTFIRDEMGEVDRVFTAGPPQGAADISGIVVGDGRRIEIECKVAGRSRTPEQEHWAEFIERAGGIYELATDDEAVEAIAERVMRRVRES